MENLIEYIFLSILGNWQIMGMAAVAVLLFYRKTSSDFYENLWNWMPWKRNWILVAATGILAIQIREIIAAPFLWTQMALPTYSLNEQLIFYFAHVHIRSLLFYALMIFYLWKKMGHLLPGIIAGWFWIGFVEITFIIQHWICFHGFLGWSYYAPFIAMMIPMVIEHKRFTFSWPGSLFLASGIFMQYAGLTLFPWAVMSFNPAVGYHANPAAMPHPHLFTYLFELGQHLMKSLFTIAGCYLNLRKEDAAADH